MIAITFATVASRVNFQRVPVLLFSAGNRSDLPLLDLAPATLPCRCCLRLCRVRGGAAVAAPNRALAASPNPPTR